MSRFITFTMMTNRMSRWMLLLYRNGLHMSKFFWRWSTAVVGCRLSMQIILLFFKLIKASWWAIILIKYVFNLNIVNFFNSFFITSHIYHISVTIVNICTFFNTSHSIIFYNFSRLIVFLLLHFFYFLLLLFWATSWIKSFSSVIYSFLWSLLVWNLRNGLSKRGWLLLGLIK